MLKYTILCQFQDEGKCYHYYELNLIAPTVHDAYESALTVVRELAEAKEWDFIGATIVLLEDTRN